MKTKLRKAPAADIILFHGSESVADQPPGVDLFTREQLLEMNVADMAERGILVIDEGFADNKPKKKMFTLQKRGSNLVEVQCWFAVHKNIHAGRYPLKHILLLGGMFALQRSTDTIAVDITELRETETEMGFGIVANIKHANLGKAVNIFDKMLKGILQDMNKADQEGWDYIVKVLGEMVEEEP